MPANRIYTEGKGEKQPVTGNRCKNLGKEARSNKKMIDCLQADRQWKSKSSARGGSSASAGSPEHETPLRRGFCFNSPLNVDPAELEKFSASPTAGGTPRGIPAAA